MDKILFKAIEKYWYGLRKTVSKHLKISFSLLLEGTITSSVSLRCASWRLLKVHKMNTSVVQKIAFKAAISGRYSKPCLLLLNHSPSTKGMIKCVLL